MHKSIFFLSLIYSLHLGCSPTTVVKKYYTDSKYKKGYGMVLYSFSRSKNLSGNNGYNLIFVNNESNKKYFFSLNPPPKSYAIKPDYTNDSVERYYRILALPKGGYTIVNFELNKNYGTSLYTWKSKNKFEIPFEVNENRISYVGDYTCEPFVKNFELNISDNGIFVVSNKLQMDSLIIKNKYKVIDFNSCINETPDKNKIPGENKFFVIKE